jgi:hypothetical protein
MSEHRRRRAAAGAAIALLTVALTTAACGPVGAGGATASPGQSADTSTGTTTATSTGTNTGTSTGTTPAPGKTSAATTEQGTWKVRYGWAVPSARTSISNPTKLPLPYLAEIHVGDHRGENPGYARISFYFRNGVPAYNFQYAKQVLTEGQGTPITLEGNSFLRLQFSGAQQHDDSGRSTLTVAPARHIGYQNLKSYGFGGDFEGYITYGLGIQTTPNSDHVLQIRVGELLKKPDGKGGYFYVVAVDVATG